MGNWVYAWDSDTGALLWKKFLGTPIKGSTDIDAHNINIDWGILSTPVIDPAAGRMSSAIGRVSAAVGKTGTISSPPWTLSPASRCRRRSTWKARSSPRAGAPGAAVQVDGAQAAVRPQHR